MKKIDRGFLRLTIFLSLVGVVIGLIAFYSIHSDNFNKIHYEEFAKRIRKKRPDLENEQRYVDYWNNDYQLSQMIAHDYPEYKSQISWANWKSDVVSMPLFGLIIPWLFYVVLRWIIAPPLIWVIRGFM